MRIAMLVTFAGLSSGCNRDDPQEAANARRAPRVEPVQVVVVEHASAAREVAVTGTVEPLRSVGVVSQLAGTLEAVTVREGDVVRQGMVLARIAAPEIAAQLTSAEVALRVARTTADRNATLFEAGIITAPENEVSQSALAAAIAARAQLVTRQGFATIRAPIAGVVLERRVETGDLASPQLRLFTIGDVSTLVVRVPVSELDVTALRRGGPALVTLDALPGRTIDGTVRRVFPAADSVSRLVPVEVALAGAAARAIKPGFLARVTFRLSPRDGLILVPSTAVLENPRGAVVYVVENGKAALRTVERGTSYEGRVEITTGLSVGDSVVVAGNTLLRDGAEVRVMSPNAPVAPATDSSRTSIGNS